MAVGSAAASPTAKAGSAAHYQVEAFVENFLDHVAGRRMTHAYDGHVNCFVETGDCKAVLLDYHYDAPPAPGRWPLPGVGPFALLEETQVNHAGKMLFKWTYWHVLMRGHALPVPTGPASAAPRGEPVP